MKMVKFPHKWKWYNICITWKALCILLYEEFKIVLHWYLLVISQCHLRFTIDFRMLVIEKFHLCDPTPFFTDSILVSLHSFYRNCIIWFSVKHNGFILNFLFVHRLLPCHPTFLVHLVLFWLFACWIEPSTSFM